MSINQQVLNDYWDWYRRTMGFNPNEPMTSEENKFWDGIHLQRQMCLDSKDPLYAIYEAPPFDKQYFLAEWWDKLDIDDKKRYLTHVWLNKGPSFLLGYDWWFPYFKDVGFLTNCNADRPTKEVVLYRGAFPFIKYGLSWTDDIELAKLFGSQHDESRVYKAVVKPESILGVIRGVAGYAEEGKASSEKYTGDEYVVNYHEIEDIQEIDYVKKSN